jgi:hypothetical protein
VDQIAPQKVSSRFRAGPDHPRLGRRKRGVPNRLSGNLRAAIIEAAELHGSDGKGGGKLTGYLLYLATRFPTTYAQLLGKILPYQIDATIDQALSMVSVTITPIPSNTFLTGKDLMKLQNPLAIEHERASEIEPATAPKVKPATKLPNADE